MMTSTATALSGNFIQRIQTEKGSIEFSFLRKTTHASDKYFVLAMDKNFKAYWFSMETQGGKWVIIDSAKVPNWIGSIEAKLSEAILLNNLS